MEKEEGVIGHQSTTTIEQGYTAYPTPKGDAPTTTLPQTFFFVVGHELAKRRPTPLSRTSPASLLTAYLEQVATETSVAIIAFECTDGESAKRARPDRNAALIALLEEWLADESDYDVKTWPTLKKLIDESRLSARKRFGE